jgi:hypothetical protein
MGGKSAPQELKEYQDPTAGLTAAAAQQTANNRPSQVTPWAQTQWAQGPGGQWTQNTGFTGGLANAASSLNGQVGQSMATPFSFGQFGAMPTGDSARDQAITGAYNQATSRLDPQWQQRESMARTQLLNQGLDPTSQAFQFEMGQLGQQRNDAYGSAMNSAIGQGTSAGNSLFQNNMASRQQAVAEALRQRGMPLEEMQKLQGFLAMPGFNADNSTASMAAQGAGLNQQRLMNLLAAKQYEQGATVDAITGGVGAISSALGAAAMLSDERAKQNIVRHEEQALPGVPYASFEYKHEPGVVRRGVIAQDLEKVAPEYVQDIGGLKHVDYSFLKKGGK